MNTVLADSGDRIAARNLALVLLAMLVAMIAPRWPAIASNLLIADDWAVTYRSHLGYGRLLPALDLWLGDALTGGKYLATVWPVVVCMAALAITGWLVIRYLLRLGVALPFATLAVVSWLAHPAMNEYLLWKVTSGGALSVATAVLAFHLLDTAPGPRGFAAACAVFVLAVTGYQLTVVIPAMLYGLRIVLSGRIALGDRRLWQLPLMTIIAACIAVAIQLAAAHWASDPGDSRGLGSLEGMGRDWLIVRIQNSLNLLANLSQQAMGVVFGIRAAWKYWEVPYALLAAICVLASRWSPVPSIVRIGAAMSAILLPAAIWFFLNRVDASPRIAALGVLVYFCVAWGLLGAGRQWASTIAGRFFRGSGVALVAIFALGQVAGTVVDAEYRRLAYLGFVEGLSQLRGTLAESRSEPSRLGLAAAPPVGSPVDEGDRAPVVSYQVVRKTDYLPFRYPFFLDGIAQQNGLKPGQCPEERPCTACTVGSVQASGVEPTVKAALFSAYLIDEPGRGAIVCLIEDNESAGQSP